MALYDCARIFFFLFFFMSLFITLVITEQQCFWAKELGQRVCARGVSFLFEPALMWGPLRCPVNVNMCCCTTTAEVTGVQGHSHINKMPFDTGELRLYTVTLCKQQSLECNAPGDNETSHSGIFSLIAVLKQCPLHYPFERGLCIPTFSDILGSILLFVPC